MLSIIGTIKYRHGVPGSMSGTGDKVQFNIRVDRTVLDRFREYCRRNGLDPHGQIVLFMRRVLETEFDFQERLWSALKEEGS